MDTQQFTRGLLTGVLITLASIMLGAAVTDWADSPHSSAAFLDEGWVRGLVDAKAWLYLLLALVIYTGRWRLGLRYGEFPRAMRWAVPLELTVMLVGAAIIAIFLSWVSVHYIPCILEGRCGG